jgi:type II secretory pathway pseudopilin PulG
MKEQKGFTLVELLGIITLLGIIGLISVPIVSSIIEKSKIKSFKQTLNGIINSAKIYNAESNYKLFNNGEINLTSGIIQFENIDQIISGTIDYDDKEYYLYEVQIDKYCAVGTYDKYTIYKDNCDSGIVLENNFDNN